MWSTLDIVLGFGFMFAWALATVAGAGILVTVYCLMLGREMASKQ